MAEFKCPGCSAACSIVQTLDAEYGVLHAMPTCAVYDAAGPAEFLRMARQGIS